MTVEKAISSISQLPPEEQILVAQAIWSGLAEDGQDSISPSVQKELDRRWEDYLADKASAIPLEEFKGRIKKARENR